MPRRPKSRARAPVPAKPGRERTPPVAWPGWGRGGRPEAGGPPPKSSRPKSKPTTRPQQKPASRKKSKLAPQEPKVKKPPAKKPLAKKPKAKRRSEPRSIRQGRVPRSVAEAFAQIHALQAAIASVKAEADARVKAIELENKRLRDEAEALRAKPKIAVLPADELPEGFKMVEEERPPASREIVYKKADEITAYLGAVAGCLRLAGIQVRLRATFIRRDNRWADGEILINIPRGMTTGELTYGEVGECIQRLGPLPGTWITLGWYFTVRAGHENKDNDSRFLRYRGGYAAFANAQHADTIGIMSENLITANKIAESYQKKHRSKKPERLIFRLIWTTKRSPYYVGSDVWDRNGGQAPSD